MPPEPLRPAYPTPGTKRHRFWLWDGREIDLSAPQPRLVATAVLAHQDADTDEDRDIAEVLAWTVELHPPWSGPGCPTCATRGSCADQRLAEGLALEFLIRKSSALVARSQANIARLDRKRAQP